MEHTLFTTGLVPVVTITDADKAEGLGKALSKGGIPIAEITFRTPAAADGIRHMADTVPDVLVGAGTVINTELAKKAIQAGAKFIVSPGFNPGVVQYCLEQGVPVIPGINNPAGIEAALEAGLTTVKFFPAEASGGTTMLKALSAPFPQVRFMPTGGISPANLGDYASLDSVLAIGGSWMVPSDRIASNSWEEITQLCKTARTTLQGFSFAHLGINSEGEQHGGSIARFFSNIGFPVSEGSSSYFVSDLIEVMKSPFRGSNGHIALNTHNIARAIAFLASLGFTALESTAKYRGEKMIAIYLEPEIAGFAIHLLKK
jgi:2-dehydro-3-deoxyphosphogluconate aldolase/(4S)-4-hydroxy-2-oxoglutarate aldolase